MKISTYILLFLLLSLYSESQSVLYNKVKKVQEIDYYVTTNKYENRIINHSYTVISSKNWYNEQAKIINSNKYNDTISIIDNNKIIGVETLFIKSKKQLIPKFYGRARIQKWTFVNSYDAKIIADKIKNDSLKFGVRLYKAPWTFWINKNELFFILTEGTYMQEDLLKIEIILKN